jgi:hypothetical protein
MNEYQDIKSGVLLKKVSCDKLYEVCPESIQPFRIFREGVAWPWCNLAAGQKKPYCASVNSHTPVGLVSRQWDAVDWTCVLCDRRIYNDRASRSANLYQRAYPFYGARASFYSKTSHYRGMSAPQQPRFGSLRLLGFPKAKIAFESKEIGKCDGHTLHKLSQRRLTADWLNALKSDYSRKHSNVSSDRLPSYIKATIPVLEIFEMAEYFPDRSRKSALRFRGLTLSPSSWCYW